MITNIRKYGDAPYKVALLHGGPGAPGYMAPVARELSQEMGVLEPLQTRDSLEGQIQELKNQLTEHADCPLVLIGSSWGAVLALFITGTTINIVALIGVIMLAGIVVNNAIVLVDLINQLRAQGVERIEAIMEAGRARLRPILMTSLTTALGLLPMAMGFGEGSEVRTPMAITVIGGLVVSTLLTLLVIPVVYSLMDRKRWPVTADEPVTADQ